MSCGPWDYDPNAEMPRQRKDWDCSAAATAWMGRSIGWGWEELDVAWSFQELGIATPQVGLLAGTGAGIVHWLSLQPLPARNYRTTWSMLVDRDWSCPLIMGSSSWYHWVGVRGLDENSNLDLANSAPGWAGVYQTLTQARFDSFGDFYAVEPVVEP